MFILCGCINASQQNLPKDLSVDQTPSVLNSDESILLKNPELPWFSDSLPFVEHSGFSLYYDEQHEQARWVAYELTREECESSFSRTDKFLKDPLVVTETANHSDYSNSGFDRGHLAPAADMGWSEQSMRESFFYSNISPQLPQFNRGIWKKLEEQCRSWAIDNERIYIVTGPVLKENLPKIGPNEVSVPEYFYKVILVYTEPDLKAIGFVLRNEGTNLPVQNFAVSIDSVERLTGINFFHALPDASEEPLESAYCIPCWNWAEQKSLTIPNNSKSTQCKGITKAGNPCKNFTHDTDGFCHHHKP